MNINSPTDLGHELRAIHTELQRLRENQVFTARAVKALPQEFMNALMLMHEQSVTKKGKAMNRTKKVLSNLLLIVVFCVGIFFLMLAVRPAPAHAYRYYYYYYYNACAWSISSHCANKRAPGYNKVPYTRN